MSEKLYTVAVLKAQTGKSDELVAVLEELAKQTRQEAGALQYGFYRNQEDPNIILPVSRTLLRVQTCPRSYRTVDA